MPPFPWPPCRSSQRMQTAWTLPWISSPLNRSRRSPAGTSTLLRGPVVGRLKEYDGWDFSEIEKEEKKEEPKQRSEPVMFRKGDKAKLLDLEDEALNGKTGKLLSLVVGTGKFAIELDDSDGAAQVDGTEEADLGGWRGRAVALWALAHFATSSIFSCLLAPLACTPV
ncbi:unnamed protein product [Effrenium voratum]|uniref:Uncharacterized protein n=1 Tax=Effrenium voratum TaxID=2562239 RepID=A0AA36IF44_9DINO|nr:unnamed protein product [Effrenium voratum]CAJ1439254.1 unnamed protein product [Effrenium voratum]